MNRIRLLMVLGGIALGLAVLLWLNLERPGPPIRVGLAINLSGQGGTAGGYIREGAVLAVEAVNRRGGVRGRPLELVIRDDGNTKEGVIRADRELLDAGVLVIIGHLASENTVAAHEFLSDREVLLFTPYTATTRLSGLDDLFLRTSVDNASYGRGMARLLEQRAAKRAAFLMDTTNPSFTEDYLVQTGRHFAGMAHPVRFDPREVDGWNGAVDRVLETGPDAVVMLTEVSMTGIAAQKIRERGYDGPLLATLWAQTPDLMRYGGSAVEGMSLLTFIDPENDSPEFRSFSALAEQRLKRPANARSTRAYEAVMILAEAMRLSPELTVQALKRTLLANRFHTLMGDVNFDPFGEVQRPLFEVQVRDGRFATVQSLR